MSDHSSILLDTHVFLWLLAGDHSLANREILERAALGSDLLVSPISCWEIGLLAARGRIQLGTATQDWMEAALKTPGVSLLPLTAKIAIEASNLPGDFHADPADRILVASARIQTCRLATRDRKILDYAALGYLKVLAC